MTPTHEIFLTGGTGYIGRRLIPRLAIRGHRVRSLVRTGSESKLPSGDAASFAERVAPADTLVQLVGVAHFVYISVARPAPVMKAYQEARAEAEEALRSRGLNATILRPWYVLGPGHRWPTALLPFYAIAERIPSMRESARRLRPVPLESVLAALVQAVESPARGIRVVETSELRAARS